MLIVLAIALIVLSFKVKDLENELETVRMNNASEIYLLRQDMSTSGWYITGIKTTAERQPTCTITERQYTTRTAICWWTTNTDKRSIPLVHYAPRG